MVVVVVVYEFAVPMHGRGGVFLEVLKKWWRKPR